MIPVGKMTEKVCAFSHRYQSCVPGILILSMVAVVGFTDSPLMWMARICTIAPWLSVSPLYRDLQKQINLHCLTNSAKKEGIYLLLT